MDKECDWLSAQSGLRVLEASKRQAFPSPGLFVLRPFCPPAFLPVYPGELTGKLVFQFFGAEIRKAREPKERLRRGSANIGLVECIGICDRAKEPV